MNNLLKYSNLFKEEIFEEIIRGSSFKVKKIVSPPMPDGDTKWYLQEEKELVIILQGEAKIEFDNSNIISLKTGDYFLIDSSIKHRVAYTSDNPVTIWLTIYYK